MGNTQPRQTPALDGVLTRVLRASGPAASRRGLHANTCPALRPALAGSATPTPPPRTALAALMPRPAGAVPGQRRCTPGTGPDMPAPLPAAGGRVGPITRAASMTPQRNTPARATSATPRGRCSGCCLHRAAARLARGWPAALPPACAGRRSHPPSPVLPLRAVIPFRTPPAMPPSTFAALSCPGYVSSLITRELACSCGPRWPRCRRGMSAPRRT